MAAASRTGGDARVDVVEIGSRVVDVVEAAELEAGGGEVGDRGMTRRAHEPVGIGSRARRGSGEEVVGPRGPEADDHDAAAHGYGTGSGVVSDVVAVGCRGPPP